MTKLPLQWLPSQSKSNSVGSTVPYILTTPFVHFIEYVLHNVKVWWCLHEVILCTSSLLLSSSSASRKSRVTGSLKLMIWAESESKWSQRGRRHVRPISWNQSESEAPKLIVCVCSCPYTYFRTQVGMQQDIAIGVNSKGVAIGSELYKTNESKQRSDSHSHLFKSDISNRVLTHPVCRCLLFDFIDCNVDSHDSQDELVLQEEQIRKLLAFCHQAVHQTVTGCKHMKCKFTNNNSMSAFISKNTKTHKNPDRQINSLYCTLHM